MSSLLPAQSPGTVVLAAHIKKLKTLKKKFFVLRTEAVGHPACLEYYDSKKKYESRQPPKRTISVRSCFNINKRKDTKHKHVIALYTKDDCFCLVLDNEKDLEEWLNALLLLQNGDQQDGEQPRPTFEHIWQVSMQKKGLGERKNIHGLYRLCLTDRVLSLIKLGTDDKLNSIEFSLSCIRRSGCMDRIFYMEVGRSAVTGGGEFWMEVEDNNIAQNMHHAINNAMTNSSSSKEEGPRQRMRSSSANEASKPISVLQRRHTTQKLHSFSPLEEQRMHEEQVESLQQLNITASAPSQCSQSQTTSTSNTHMATDGIIENGIVGAIVYTKSSAAITNRRRHSVASHPIPSANISQSIHTNTTSSSSSTSTTATATISHQRTLSLPLAAVAIGQTLSSKRSVLRCVPTVRDRCDSLPSRARTTSEGHSSSSSTMIVSVQQQQQQYHHQQHQQYSRTGHLMTQIPRPHSMHSRVMSYSPPVASIPVNPTSATCSTDSAGSSLSMDDTSENMEESAISKYGHSLTPDEPVILEESTDDYVPWSINHQQKYSPNFKSCSPLQNSYVEMYSPCSSSPGKGAYITMSPAICAHSRASSLVEENSTLSYGYVSMAPVGDDGYVDMDPIHNHNGHFADDMSPHGGSSCSVTSGTPSTDLRFSEYHLDKVTSFLAPGEDLQARPTRAYSVGSRPEQANRHRKNRLDIAQQESSRVRAFSVGSRSKRPEIGRLAKIVTAPLTAGIENSHSNKSSSAPLLSSSWGHNSGCSITSERMEDLMELDFTRPNVPITLSSSPTLLLQSQTYSTATNTSSYIDMSPGHLPISIISCVDMNGPIKINRNNSNNNNNITTANHNHNHNHNNSLITVSTHKPIIMQVSSLLKPVEEADSSYAKMNGPIQDWCHLRISPKQVPSPCQDDYTQMNGPPGVTRTAPMDLPQPRAPPEGYVEMSFKAKTSLEQDYINMSIGLGRNNRRHHNNRKKKCSLPIAIQAGSKSSKTPNFLLLNNSPTSDSLESTPASPPRVTLTGSTATIFPFSLNSPQSPVKSFNMSQADNEKSSLVGEISSIKNIHSTVLPATRKISAPSPLPGVDGCPSSKKAHDNIDSYLSTTSISRNISNSACKEPLRVISNSMNLTQEAMVPLSPITKKLSDLTVSKPRFVTASPTTSPTPSGFKPKAIEDLTPTLTSTVTANALDSEGYEKLQPGATLLHYASLDLPEIAGAPPISPTTIQEVFNYAEIDFAKLKQN